MSHRFFDYNLDNRVILRSYERRKERVQGMAEILGHISVQILDSLGVTASAPYYVQFDDSEAAADIDTAAAAILTDLDAVTDGQIVAASLVYSIPLPGGLKSSPVAGSEVERGGLFNFSQDGIKYKFGVLVPAFKTSLIVNGKINLAATAVSTFLAIWTAIGGDLVPVSTAGRLLEVFKDALVVFRKHRKAENRRSFEV
jgi:hypothetical protein